VLTSRPVWFIGDPDDRALARCLAAAPSAKLDSPYEYLVLELRSDWPVGSRMHGRHVSLAILAIGDVLAHHALAEDARNYYAAQVEAAGVRIAERTFESEWSRWVLAERRDHAKTGARMLAARLVKPPIDDPAPSAPAAAEAIDAGLGVTVETGVPAAGGFAELAHRAQKIYFEAADVRTIAAYYLATAIVWARTADGPDPRDNPVIGEVLDRCLQATDQMPWSPAAPIWDALEPGFVALNREYESAFSAGVRAETVGIAVRILTEHDGNTLEPDALAALLRRALAVDRASGLLLCHLAAGALGPERTWQVVRLLDADAERDAHSV
jgi:hypothetical protein